MKILFINVDYKNSSTGNIVYLLKSRFESKGYFTKVVYGRGKNINERNIHKISNFFSNYFHVFITRFFGLIGIGSFLPTLKTKRIINKFKPDIINIHQIHGYYINIYSILKFIAKKRIKTFITAHDYFYITGKCGYTKGCSKWEKVCFKCPQKKSYPKSLLFDFSRYEFKLKNNIYKLFNDLTFLPVSNWLALSYKKSPMINKFNIIPVHNGLDTINFDIHESNEIKIRYNIQNKKVILHVTSNFFGEMKGGKYFIDIASKFSSMSDVVFILIGAPSNISLPPNVINIGKTKNQIELAKFYSCADITLLTSLEETFSLIVAESLLCGVPVIGFKAGAPSEVAPEGYGLWVDQGRVDLIYEYIIKIVNKDYFFKSKNDLRNFAIEKYSIENMVNNYEKIFISNNI